MTWPAALDKRLRPARRGWPRERCLPDQQRHLFPIDGGQLRRVDNFRRAIQARLGRDRRRQCQRTRDSADLRTRPPPAAAAAGRRRNRSRRRPDSRRPESKPSPSRARGPFERDPVVFQLGHRGPTSSTGSYRPRPFDLELHRHVHFVSSPPRASARSDTSNLGPVAGFLAAHFGHADRDVARSPAAG